MTELGMKGASGLGDAIYGYPIVKYFTDRFDRIYHMCNYPEIYESLPTVSCHRHLKLNHIVILEEKDETRKIPITVRFSYGPGKYKEGSSQFEDACRHAGISRTLDLRIPWTIRNQELVDTVRLVAKKRPICIVAAPYTPFGRTDGFGSEMRINPDTIQSICEHYREQILFISTGNNFVLHRPRAEYDLIDQTSVTDLMDLVSMSDMTLSQVGNLVPMSECLGKKNFIIFGRGGLESKERFVRAITPEKVIHYKKLNTSVVDDDKDIVEKFGGFCGKN